MLLEEEKTVISEDFSIRVNKSGFASVLSHVQSIVERRNIVPVLSNVLIEASGGKLKLTATDMDIIVSEKIEATVTKSGAITVDAHMLYDIVRKLEDGLDIKIDFDSAKKKVNLLSSNSKFSLSVLSASDFPKLDDDIYGGEFNVQSKELRSLIDQCKFAISAEETRYNLNGVFMHFFEGHFRMVATDGHRLSCADGSESASVEGFEGIIIPKKSILEIRKIIDSTEGEVKVSVSENKVKISNGNFVFVTKLIGAKFPDYQNLMPEDNHITLKIPTKEFSKAVDRVSTITNEKFKGIKFELSGSEFHISSKNNDGSFATEKISVESGEHKFEIGFNARYISDVMGAIKGEEIILKFKDNFSPAVMLDVANDKFQYIIMPMRV
jgi:DNA polymerase III subunit beta